MMQHSGVKMAQADQWRRISLMLREDQYQALASRSINLSGLIRDLLDDYLSESKVILQVTESSRSIYNQILSQTGANDDDLEPYFLEALRKFLRDRVTGIQKLEAALFETDSQSPQELRK